MISRRSLCLTASVLPLVGLVRTAQAQDADDPWPDIRDALFGDRTIAEDDGIITLEAPKRAYDAAIVPVTVHAGISQAADRYVRAVHLIIDKNPAPEAAVFHFMQQRSEATLQDRI